MESSPGTRRTRGATGPNTKLRATMGRLSPTLPSPLRSLTAQRVAFSPSARVTESIWISSFPPRPMRLAAWTSVTEPMAGLPLGMTTTSPTFTSSTTSKSMESPSLASAELRSCFKRILTAVPLSSTSWLEAEDVAGGWGAGCWAAEKEATVKSAPIRATIVRPNMLLFLQVELKKSLCLIAPVSKEFLGSTRVPSTAFALCRDGTCAPAKMSQAKVSRQYRGPSPPRPVAVATELVAQDDSLRKAFISWVARGCLSFFPSLALLPEHPLFQVGIGRLGPQPHREQHWAEGRTGNGQLVLAVEGEGGARARNVSEDHFVARLDGLERREQAVDVGLHRLQGVRRIVLERVVEGIRHLLLAGVVHEVHDDPLGRVGLEDGVGIRRLLLQVEPRDVDLHDDLGPRSHAVEHQLGVPDLLRVRQGHPRQAGSV